MFIECKKVFLNNNLIYDFIIKSEIAYQQNNYPSAIILIKHAYEIFLKQNSNYETKEFTALCKCKEKLETEFAKIKQCIVQETGYKTTFLH